MSEHQTAEIDTNQIKTMLDKHQAQIKMSLSVCAHCTLCAESCFLYMTRDKKPEYVPSFKLINSIGKLYKEKGNVDRAALEEIKDIVWKKCVLCTRCYCPFGIDIPYMIALGRNICRSQGILPQYDN